MTPRLGDLVYYLMSQADADALADRGGNKVNAAETYAAFVSRVNDGGTLNLQVLLDGSLFYWAPSRAEGAEMGMWHWPEVEDD